MWCFLNVHIYIHTHTHVYIYCMLQLCIMKVYGIQLCNGLHNIHKKRFVLAAFHLLKWHFVKRKRRKKNIEEPQVVTLNFAPLYFGESWRSKHETLRFQIVRTSTFYGKIEAALQPAWKTAWVLIRAGRRFLIKRMKEQRSEGTKRKLPQGFFSWIQIKSSPY